MSRPKLKIAYIYKIKNSVTGKSYVGHTARQPEKRFWFHLNQLRKNEHHSISLQRAYNKYGEIAFSFSILEECLAVDKLIREQFWIDKLVPEYNIAPVAGSPLGLKRSEEVRERMKIAAAKRAEKFRGKRRPGSRPEVSARNKISAVVKHNSEETKRKISLGCRKPKHAGFGPAMSGEKNNHARFTNEEVAYIRSVYKPHSKEFGRHALAKKFGVYHSLIDKIVRRVTYTV